MKAGQEFFNLYNHDFVRVAVAIPPSAWPTPTSTRRRPSRSCARRRRSRRCSRSFPSSDCPRTPARTSSSSARCSTPARPRSRELVARVAQSCPSSAVVGHAPRTCDHQLYNCAAVVARGRILGVVPKTYLPNYREFYELRQFRPADAAHPREDRRCAGSRRAVREPAPVRGRGAAAAPLLRRDLRGPLGADSAVVLRGARRRHRAAESLRVQHHRRQGRLPARARRAASRRAAWPRISTRRPAGESTTDLAWDGHALVYENGTLLAESRRFAREPQLVVADVDLERLAQERMRQNTFGQSARAPSRPSSQTFRTIDCSLALPRRGPLLPRRRYERFPYVPADPATRDERCAEVFHIQVQGLVKRLRVHGHRARGDRRLRRARLDARAARLRAGHGPARHSAPQHPRLHHARLRHQRPHPGAGATADGGDRLRGPRARHPARAALQMLRDIGHPVRARAQPLYDVTFENVQAGERTSHLFRLANHHGGLVVGTGDLSELALGWCTYGVGDHMSHYAVNASVPKTLIQHVIRWVAETRSSSATAAQRCAPRGPRHRDQPRARSAVGRGAEPAPEHRGDHRALRAAGLQSLLHAPLRLPAVQGCLPRLLRLARLRARAPGPTCPLDQRRQYDIGRDQGCAAHLPRSLLPPSQYKRSCIPNGPKVGSGGSLSPRGD